MPRNPPSRRLNACGGELRPALAPQPERGHFIRDLDGSSQNVAEAVNTNVASKADMMLLQAQKLRRRAAHCRDMARGALSDELVVELEAIAAEFERDATTLETCAGQAVGKDFKLESA